MGGELGHMLIDPDGPIETWIDAVTRLWSDERHYREKSQAALAYSRRPDIAPDKQIGKLISVAALASGRVKGAEASNAPGAA